MATLLQIGDEAAALAALIDELPDGELTPEAATALEAWFAQIGEQRDKKIDGYCAIIRELELRSDARHEEAARLAKLASGEANIAKRLRDRLKLFFELTGLQRVDTQRFRVSLAGNGGVRPVHIDCDAGALPEAFRKVECRADLPAIRDALLTGATIPGCRLDERGKSLRIA